MDYKVKTLFDEIQRLCDEVKIRNTVKPRGLILLIDRYEGKIKMKVQVRSCLVWMVDNDKRALSTMRLNNWFSNSLEYQKRDELKLLHQKKDAR